MKNQFYFRGRVDAQVRDGVLYVPREVEDFYRLRRNYVHREGEIQGYRFLAVHPRLELMRSLFGDVNRSRELPNKFVPLEKVVRGYRTRGLKLPTHSLEYLDLEQHSTAKIIGGERPYFEVWKPEDFARYESSETWGDIKISAQIIGL